MAQSESDVERVFDALGQEAVAREPIPEELRWDIYLRDRFQCCLCGTHRFLSIDHRIPLARGGSNEPDNFITMCRSCNSQKGTKTLDEAIEERMNRKPITEPIGAVGIWGYRCKCGHEWLGRGKGEPPYCPKCKRRTWNRA